MANTKVKAEQLEAAQTNITSLGTLTSLTVDDITIDGSTISDGGDLTLDVTGDIILDAEGSDVRFHNAGTLHGRITNDSNGLWFISDISDKDIYIRGNDGGSMVTALTFDMSDAGKATFNSGIVSTGALFRAASSGATADASADELVVENSANAGISILSGASNTGSIYFGDSGTNWDGYIAYSQNDRQMTLGTAAATRMTIRAAGGVGIGTAGYDSQILAVNAGTGDTVLYGESTDANCFASFRDNSSTANISYGAIGNDHVFRADNNERMRINSSGNVGIGTSSPDTLLDIEYTASNHTQGIHITNSQPGGYGNAITFISERSDNNSLEVAARIGTQGAAAWNADNTTNSNLIFEARDANTLSEKMRVTANGDLCVGVTSNAGSASNTKRIRGGIFATYQGATAATHNTPTTMFSLPSGLGTYILSAGFDGIGRTDLYSSLAIVHGDGTSYKMTTLTTSTSMSWDISGSNVRVQQSSGSTLNVSWSMIRIQQEK